MSISFSRVQTTFESTDGRLLQDTFGYKNIRHIEEQIRKLSSDIKENI